MIRVAVLGLGRWGPNLLRNLNNGRTCQVKWAIDPSEARRQAFAERYPDIHFAESHQAALHDSGVDAFVIATPTTTHYELCKDALLAKKHVLVEKPLTADSAQAEELCELSEKTGRFLMVGHVFLFNGAVRQVKSYIDAGELGRIYYIAMTRTNLGPVRTDVNAAWDLAAHDISISNYWLDECPVSASALGGVWLNEGIEDAVFATLRYPKGEIVTLHASWLNPRKARDITITAERKMVTFDDTEVQEPIRIYEKSVNKPANDTGAGGPQSGVRPSLRDGDIHIPKVAMVEPLQNECDHFIQSIATGTAPQSGARSATSVVYVLEAITRSMKNGGREQEVQYGARAARRFANTA